MAEDEAQAAAERRETAGAGDEVQPARGRPGCWPGCLLVPLGLVLCAAVFGLWWFSRLAEEQRRLSAHVEELVAAHRASRPEVPPDQDAAPLYRAAYALYVRSTDAQIERGQTLGAAPGALERHLADNAAYLQALRKALAKPGFSPFDDISAGFLAVMPTVQDARQAARFLSLVAQSEARQGRPGPALEAVTMILRVGRDIDADASLIGHMVCTACESIAADALEQVLENSRPSEAELRAMLAALDAHRRSRRSLDRVFAENKVAGLVTFEQLASRKLTVGRLTGAGPGGAAAERVWRASGGPIRDARTFERLMDDAARAAGLSPPEARAELERIDAESARMTSGRFPGSVLGLFSWDMVRVWVRDSRGLARVELMRLAVGCRVAALKTGAPPAKLEELRSGLPDIFPELPADPFTGKPFGYARTGQGFKIWSVDEDARDDGGTKRGPNSPRKGKYDIVFEVTK